MDAPTRSLPGADALSQAYSGWARQARWVHVAAVALIALAALARFYPAVTSATLLGDELPRQRALELAASGSSPYAHGGDVYPPSLLRLGAILRRLSPEAPFATLRAATLLGLAVLVWCAVAWLPWRLPHRLAAALLVVVLSPGVRQGVEFGNLSFLVGGMILAALYGWRRAPVTSGLLLAGSLLVKPLAPAALVAMAARRLPGWRHWITAGVAGVVAGGVLLLDPELGAFARQGSRAWEISRTVSSHRLLALAGAPGAAVGLTLALLATVAFVGLRFVRGRASLVAVALAGCVTMSPVVWNHTLVLTLPLQAMAATVLLARRRDAEPRSGARRPMRFEIAGVTLAIAALELAEGATGIDDRGFALQALATLPIALAPAALAAYVLRFGVERPSAGSP